jgi:hypothetical protein
MSHNNGGVINLGKNIVSKFEIPPHMMMKVMWAEWFESHPLPNKTTSDDNLVHCLWIMFPFCGELEP